MRIGHGYDIHRFEETSTKDYIMMGGVKIPHDKGLIAHSDGDVVVHAICDALLGACALGDIGKHFPDTSSEYKNCDSRNLLREVVKKVTACGYSINNIDVSILAQRPRMLPHVLLMKENLSKDMHISVNDINIKATTNEGLDAVGHNLGIAVHAVCLIAKEHK